jgi:protein disulfide isomerase family A protein 3
MKSDKTISLTIIFCLLCRSFASDEKRWIDFSEYDVEEFKAELESYDVIAILFYAPFCVQCVDFIPHFQKAHKTIVNNKMDRGSNLNFETGETFIGKLDCTTATGTKVCTKFRISGYPTIKLFKFGNEYLDFETDKYDYVNILKWMRDHFVNPSLRYNSFSSLNKKMISFNEPMVISIFKNSRNNEELELWMKSARALRNHWNYRDVSFCHIFEDYAKGSMSELSAMGLSTASKVGLPLIVIHKPKWLLTKHEKNNIVYDSSKNEDLELWMKRKIFGSVVWRTRDNAEEIKLPLIVAYYDYDFKNRNEFSHLWRDRILLVSNDYPDITFAISSSQSFRKQLRRKGLKLSRDQDPPLIVAQDTFGTEYVMKKQFTSNAFRDFVEKFKAGQLKPFIGSLRSQKEVSNEDRTLPKVVVSSNFPRMVTHSQKDVLIMFYVPWCKHSQAILPMFDELALTFADEPNLDILKMDLDLNESPSTFQIPMYPTIYFIPAESKEKIIYKSGPQLHFFVQFVAQHASNELQSFDRNGSPRSRTEMLDQEMTAATLAGIPELDESTHIRSEL